MDDRLQRAETPARPPEWSHEWHPYEDYLTIHASHMRSLLRDGSVIADRLTIQEFRRGRTLIEVNIRGLVECRDGIMFAVDKWLEVRPGRQRRPEVKGKSYSYHAWIPPDRNLVRWDTAHGLKDLHRHDFDRAGGATETRIQIKQLPTLGDAIREALQRADVLREAEQ